MAIIEKARIILEDGTPLDRWDSYSIDTDFLTPTDGWSFTVGGEEAYVANIGQLQPDYRVQLYVDGMLQLTGFIDNVSMSSTPEGGLVTTVTGRDILRPLCKANMPPDFKVDGLTIEALVESLLPYYYKQGQPNLITDSQSQRSLLDVAASVKPKDRAAMLKKLVERTRANPGDGAFEFIARNIRRFGLWLWAMPNGDLVLGGPEYEQAPAYKIQRRRGERSVAYPSATYERDRTQTPSFISVRAKTTAKEWAKGEVFGAIDMGARDHWFVEPAYMQNDSATTMEECYAFALQELTRLTESSEVYTCTAVGHRDHETGNMFQVNTIATIEDDILGVRGDFWVSRRTFRKDLGGGTTTELRLVPKGSIQFGEADFPPGSPGESEEKKPAPIRNFGKPQPRVLANAPRGDVGR